MSTENDIEWTWGLSLKTILFSTIVLGTIVGNSMVLTAIFLNHTLRSPTHIFIGNLALADLLVGILVLPCNATTQISGKWLFGDVYCAVWVCSHRLLCSASSLSLCAICLDRYIGVSQPLKHFYLMRASVVRSLIAGVWVMAFCLGVIPFFIWPDQRIGGHETCKSDSGLGLVVVRTFGTFYIPSAMMLILYWKIYQAALKHVAAIREGQKRFKLSKDTTSTSIRIHTGGNTSRSTDDRAASASVSSSSTENLLSVNMGRQTKAAKKLTVVVGAFIFCYCPFFTGSLITGIQKFQQKEVTIPADLSIVFGWMRYSNSCLNPMLYAAMLPAFRKAFKGIISCRNRK